MASIREVAKKAGVSIATVSRVMNGHHTVAEHLRVRVLNAAKACDYNPHGTKSGASTIGLLYTKDFYLNSPYDSAVFAGMSDAMRHSQYDLVLLDLARDRRQEETFKQFFARKRVGGAIVRSAYEQRDLLLEMAGEDLPMVVLGDHFQHESLKFVYSDSREASREAIDYLIAMGHKKIAFVQCERDDGDHIDRMNAYREGLEAEGLYDESRVYRVPPFRMDGVPLARRLLTKSDRPTAIFIADPMVTVGIVNECTRLGVRIPEDISIVGFDDTDTRHMLCPRVTAVCQDSRQIGEKAFEAVRELMEGKSEGEAPATPPEAWFEIHESTGTAPESVKAVHTNNVSPRTPGATR